MTDDITKMLKGLIGSTNESRTKDSMQHFPGDKYPRMRPLIDEDGMPTGEMVEEPDSDDPLENASRRGDMGADMRWEIEKEIREIEALGKPSPDFIKRLDEMYREWEAISPEDYMKLFDRYEKATGQVPQM
jgi:hypothetical protein